MEERIRMLTPGELLCARFVLGFALLASACGGAVARPLDTEDGAPLHDGGERHETETVRDSGSSNAIHDVGPEEARDARSGSACVSDPAGSPGESFASGALSGPELACSVCDVGMMLQEMTGSDGPAYVLIVGVAVSGGGSCSVPAGATGPMFASGGLILPSPAPGTYSSGGDAGAVGGGFLFSYQLPDGDTEVYGVASPAASPSDFSPGVQAWMHGSWTVTLTSVEAVDGGTIAFGMAPYLVHGSLTATLVEPVDGGAGPTAALHLAF
jgi:hypothetical protein